MNLLATSVIALDPASVFSLVGLWLFGALNIIAVFLLARQLTNKTELPH